MTLTALFTPNTSLRPFNPSLKFSSQPLRSNRVVSHTFPFTYLSSAQLLVFKQVYERKFGLGFVRKFGFTLKADNGEGKRMSSVDKVEEEEEARGQSTMPERFRYLTKEVPERPVRWPWLIALVFLIYAWRTVFWELSNWKKAAVGVVHLVGYPFKLALALVLHFIGDPITSLIGGIETLLYSIRAIYSGVVAYAPIPELMVIITLASVVCAIAEATVPNSVRDQSNILTITGLVGFAAVRNYITELFFWVLLLGLFAFSRFIKKREYISSTFPIVAVLAAIGEPWVRFIVMISFFGLAITYHSQNFSDANKGEGIPTNGKVPLPLLCAALAIGVRVAAKWVGHRHLTWMIV